MNMDESFDTMLDEEMARAQDLPTSGMEEFDFIRQFAGDHVPEHLMRNRVVLDPDEAVALHRLLARGMDVQKYVEKYDELPYIDFTDDEDTFDVTNVDRFCKFVHQGIYNHIVLTDGVSICERDGTRAQETWLSNNWMKEKAVFNESLGHRTSYNKNYVMANTIDNTKISSKTKKFISNSDSIERAVYPSEAADASNTTSGLSTIKAEQAAIIKKINLDPNHIRNINTSYPDIPGNIVRSSVKYFPCREMRDKLDLNSNILEKSSGVSDGIPPDQYTNYKLLFDMLVYAVESETEGVEPGWYSPLCYGELIYDRVMNNNSAASAVKVNGILERKIQLITGTKLFYENQQYFIISKFMEDLQSVSGVLELPPLPDSSSTFQERLLLGYVDYLHNNNVIIEKPNSLFRVISTASNSYNIPVWAYVFYCLRVGDLSAVRREILSPVSMLPGSDRDRMLVILDHLITVQSRKARVVAARNVLDAIDYFRQEYNRSKAISDGDPYRLLVLRLFAIRYSDEDIRFSHTMEDYLWCQLWHIEYMRMILPDDDPCLTSNFVINGTAVTVTKGLFLEDNMYERILTQFNARKQHMNPFSYCYALISCHRYGHAISHLWESQLFFVSVQLLSICVYYGLVLPHTKLIENPKYCRSNFTNEIISNIPDITPSTMLSEEFNQTFMYQYPEVTLTYFVILRTSNWYAHYTPLFGENLTEKQLWMQCSNKLLVDLLITLKDSKAALRSILGGHDTAINKARIRKPLPLLDQFIGGNVSTEVDTLIRLVATRLRFDYGYNLGAVYFYQLCGDIQEIVSILIDEISAIVSKDISSDLSEEDEFWLEYAHGNYLPIKRKEFNGDVAPPAFNSLCDRFVNLWKIHQFFVLFAQRNLSASLHFLHNELASLIPFDSADVEKAVREFSASYMHTEVGRYIGKVVNTVLEAINRLLESRVQSVKLKDRTVELKVLKTTIERYRDHADMYRYVKGISTRY